MVWQRYMRHQPRPSMVQIMACCLSGAKWLSKPMVLIGNLGTNVSEILIEIYIFSFKKMHLKMSSGKCQPFCLDYNVLTYDLLQTSLHKIESYNINFTMYGYKQRMVPLFSCILMKANLTTSIRGKNRSTMDFTCGPFLTIYPNAAN